MCNRGFQAADGQRILRTHINVAICSAAGNARDHHAFQHPVGITFHDAPVHECARIALITVADDKFHFGLLPLDLGPFTSGRISTTAASPQIGLVNYLDDFIRTHIEQRLFKRFVPADRQIFLQGSGVDVPAVFQYQPGLFFIERDFFLRRIMLVILAIGEAIHNLVRDDRFFNDLGAISQFHLDIQPAMRFDPNQGSHLAKTVTTALFHANRIIMRFFFKTDRTSDAFFANQPDQLGVYFQ